jgi:hypothetical protein
MEIPEEVWRIIGDENPGEDAWHKDGILGRGCYGGCAGSSRLNGAGGGS